LWDKNGGGEIFLKIDKSIIAVAALLHDVGKLMRRGGSEGTHYYNSFFSNFAHKK
jgi:HD superfamily phosphodiesterase